LSEAVTLREVVVTEVKNRFGGKEFWREIELGVAVHCANIPEIFQEEKKQDLLDALRKLYNFLVFAHPAITEQDVAFIEEYINRFGEVKQISLYEEKENSIPQQLIDAYSAISHIKEGVVGIPELLNYHQLKILTNGVWKKTGDIKFFISMETTVGGKITGEFYDNVVNIPLASMLESIKKDTDTGKPLLRQIGLFGEKVDTRNFYKVRDLEFPMRVYRFLSDKQEDFIVLSKDLLDAGEYVLSGMVVQVDDNKILTESARLPSKLPFFFIQKAKNRIIQYKSHAEFFAQMDVMQVTEKNTFNYPFTIVVGGKNYLMKQPEWFKWLMWSWLTHHPSGIIAVYPLHILITGIKHTGKSVLLNCLHARSKEVNSVFSGANSTLKSLVPSFSQKPPKPGYLVEANRFAFCDEFLRCVLSSSQSSMTDDRREERIAMMNDLLEHQKREMGSGVAKIRPNTTARVLAATNPVRDTYTMEDLLRTSDESFLSRWLVYYQNEDSDHVKIIRRSKDKKLEEYKWNAELNTWVSIFDYLQSFPAKWNDEKVAEIQEEVIPVLSTELHRHYDARHSHHIDCVMDGIIKTRCLFERDETFTAQPQDYERLRDVWCKVITSWIDVNNIKKAPVERRIHYLPEFCQWLFKQLTEEKRMLEVGEFYRKVELHIRRDEFYRGMVILKEQGLVLESGMQIYPFYFDKKKKGEHEESLNSG